jgi:hypothetical protein
VRQACQLEYLSAMDQQPWIQQISLHGCIHIVVSHMLPGPHLGASGGGWRARCDLYLVSVHQPGSMQLHASFRAGQLSTSLDPAYDFGLTVVVLLLYCMLHFTVCDLVGWLFNGIKSNMGAFGPRAQGLQPSL